jgi:protein ImuA
VENPADHETTVESLRQQIAQFETTPSADSRGYVSSGCGPLDRLLVGAGFRRGTLVEWLGGESGGGVSTLALATARAACCDGGALVVLDRRCEFYPPAAVRLGIDPQNLIVVRADGDADKGWALDQALRCRAVAAVLAWPEKLDSRTFRRLQLAAEESGTLGLLIRDESVRHEPSWADARLLVEALPLGQGNMRRLRIHLLRCRGTTSGRSVDVDIDDETRTMYLAAELAIATARRKAARA